LKEIEKFEKYLGDLNDIVGEASKDYVLDKKRMKELSKYCAKVPLIKDLAEMRSDAFIAGVEWLANYLLSEKVLPIGYGVRVTNEVESPEGASS
jgi:hypothetical protein